VVSARTFAVSIASNSTFAQLSQLPGAKYRAPREIVETVLPIPSKLSGVSPHIARSREIRLNDFGYSGETVPANRALHV
jgi:hypothetical protein